MPTDDYEAFQEAVLRVMHLDLRLYKREQMERRLRAYGQQHGFSDLKQLAKALGSEAALPQQLLSYLTIHVSEFFRDPRFFEQLRALLPQLPGAPHALRVWSAGCSIGAEAYSLVMLLSEERPGQPYQVLATDLDDQSLDKARRGLYREEELRQVDLGRRRRYFAAEGKEFRIRPDLQRSITFRHHDLLADPYPAEQDLILFRNVAIYFTEEAKDQVLHGLARSLAAQGILMVGSTEAILRPQDYGLRQVRPFFFVRV
ncbi:MAG: protein-glutamate O-methyltransferase CheR [Thermaerobacter sp.]|nr:protein-glutamate O-methyltransferase CheR [Thermaerobacter sp.]